MTSGIKHFLPAMLAFIFLLAGATGCSDKTAGADSAVDDATLALADGDNASALRLCNKLMASDFDRLDEQQLCRMALVYARVSESEPAGEDHIAEATRCITRALELSADSLRGFRASLSAEETGQFEMLVHISGSISNPPDLSEEGLVEDSLHIE